MPFCAIPTEIHGILARRRVVINEPHVLEFVMVAREFANTMTNTTSRASTIGPTSKKTTTKRFSEFISSTTSQPSSHQYQAPVAAPSTTFNPFYDNRFLV